MNIHPWILTPVLFSVSCAELAKVVLDELEDFQYVPNDGNLNGISDNHESVINQNGTPVNRGGIYGDTDHVFVDWPNRDIQCIYDFMSVDAAVGTNQNSKVFSGN